jgi:hypothetical protein
MTKIEYITGTIKTTDGKTRSFSISRDGNYQQWGAMKEDLGTTVDALEAMGEILSERDLIASSNDEDEPTSNSDKILERLKTVLNDSCG